MEPLLLANFLVGSALLTVHIMMFINARRFQKNFEEPQVQERMVTFDELPKEIQDELKKVFKEEKERFPQA